MNLHLVNFFSALGESLAVYIILFFIQRESKDITTSEVIIILITNFIAAYTGFYLLPWLSKI